MSRRALWTHVEELAPDLVVMSTHGRADLKRLLYGSLAQQVVAGGVVPVLLAPQGHTFCLGPSGARTVLMPLDGEKAHEEGIPLVVHLTRALGARLHLLTVVHTVQSLRGERAAAASMLPATMNAMLEMEAENAAIYLAELTAQLSTQGLAVTHSVIRGPQRRRDPRGRHRALGRPDRSGHARPQGYRSLLECQCCPAGLGKEPNSGARGPSDVGIQPSRSDRAWPALVGAQARQRMQPH